MHILYVYIHICVTMIIKEKENIGLRGSEMGNMEGSGGRSHGRHWKEENVGVKWCNYILT